MIHSPHPISIHIYRDCFRGMRMHRICDHPHIDELPRDHTLWAGLVFGFWSLSLSLIVHPSTMLEACVVVFCAYIVQNRIGLSSFWTLLTYVSSSGFRCSSSRPCCSAQNDTSPTQYTRRQDLER